MRGGCSSVGTRSRSRSTAACVDLVARTYARDFECFGYSPSIRHAHEPPLEPCREPDGDAESRRERLQLMLRVYAGGPSPGSAELEAVVAPCEDDGDLCVEIANRHLAEGNRRAARDWCDRALQAEPMRGEHWAYSALLHRGAEEWEPAVRAAQKAILYSDMALPEHYPVLARSLVRLGELEAAANALVAGIQRLQQVYREDGSGVFLVEPSSERDLHAELAGICARLGYRPLASVAASATRKIRQSEPPA